MLLNGLTFGKYAVDYEERVDYPRLRRERVEKVRAQMEADGIGAIIARGPDNILRGTFTPIHAAIR